jgi:methionyl aminopeptidase
MSYTKKPQEIKDLIEGGKRMGEILEELVGLVRPGVSTLEIDLKAEELILKAGGVPAFKGYRPRGVKTPFSGTICASLNDEVVHGIPSAQTVLKDGDVFTIDIGMRWPGPEGMFTDTATTVAVGKVSPKVRALMQVTKDALEAGLKECVAGKNLGDVGRAIETVVKNGGSYGIVSDMCGHGVGHAVHEAPNVLNYYDRSSEQWVLKPGVVLALEPMITLGSPNVDVKSDGWTIITADGSIASHEEHTVVITDGEPIVITRRPSEIF